MTLKSGRDGSLGASRRIIRGPSWYGNSGSRGRVAGGYRKNWLLLKILWMLGRDRAYFSMLNNALASPSRLSANIAATSGSVWFSAAKAVRFWHRFGLHRLDSAFVPIMEMHGQGLPHCFALGLHGSLKECCLYLWGELAPTPYHSLSKNAVHPLRYLCIRLVGIRVIVR